MIGILIYDSQESYLDLQFCLIKYWLKFYKTSNTKMPVKFFTDVEGLENLYGYDVCFLQGPKTEKEEKLPAALVLQRLVLANIDHPIVLIDPSCLLLNSIDGIISEIPFGKKMAMVSQIESMSSIEFEKYRMRMDDYVPEKEKAIRKLSKIYNFSPEISDMIRLLSDVPRPYGNIRFNPALIVIKEPVVDRWNEIVGSFSFGTDPGLFMESFWTAMNRNFGIELSLDYCSTMKRAIIRKGDSDAVNTVSKGNEPKVIQLVDAYGSLMWFFQRLFTDINS